MPRRVPRHVDAHADLLRRVSFLMRDVVMVILTVALSVAMKLSDYWVKLNRQRQEMEMVQHKEELESLKKQLNPHFLFNTLNSIYALIAISPDKAQQAVHELSQLLRYVLYENSPTVPIQDELTFIDNYVKLMKLRIGDKMPINVTLDSGDCNDCHIARCCSSRRLRMLSNTAIQVGRATASTFQSCAAKDRYIVTSPTISSIRRSVT